MNKLFAGLMKLDLGNIVIVGVCLLVGFSSQNVVGLTFSCVIAFLLIKFVKSRPAEVSARSLVATSKVVKSNVGGVDFSRDVIVLCGFLIGSMVALSAVVSGYYDIWRYVEGADSYYFLGRLVGNLIDLPTVLTVLIAVSIRIMPIAISVVLAFVFCLSLMFDSPIEYIKYAIFAHPFLCLIINQFLNFKTDLADRLYGMSGVAHKRANGWLWKARLAKFVNVLSKFWGVFLFLFAIGMFSVGTAAGAIATYVVGSVAFYVVASALFLLERAAAATYRSYSAGDLQVGVRKGAGTAKEVVSVSVKKAINWFKAGFDD